MARVLRLGTRTAFRVQLLTRRVTHCPLTLSTMRIIMAPVGWVRGRGIT